MTKIYREEVIKIAKISSLRLDEHEIQPLIEQLEQVLTYAERVKEVTPQSLELVMRNVNVVRDDTVDPCDVQPLLSQAPEREGNYFVVPMVLENN